MQEGDDVGLQSGWGTISLELRHPDEINNEPPTANGVTGFTPFGEPVTMAFNATDDSLPSDQLTYVLCTEAPLCQAVSRGSVHINGSEFTYTPNLGANGNDIFHYHAIVGRPLLRPPLPSLLPPPAAVLRIACRSAFCFLLEQLLVRHRPVLSSFRFRSRFAPLISYSAEPHCRGFGASSEAFVVRSHT